MIITRSPLRVSLGGGGTDLPSYYREHGGFLVAAAIDKYVYITLHQTFVQELIIKYSKLERVATIDEIEHPIIREALRFVGVDNPHLELTSMADIPAGTGLGSSGSFTTALLKALHAYKRNIIHPAELAAEACAIELDRLGEPIGKQDQYIAAIGGITAFTFHQNGRVEYRPLRLSEETHFNLEDNLLLFFTGYSRSASAILKDQDDRSKQNEKKGQAVVLRDESARGSGQPDQADSLGGGDGGEPGRFARSCPHLLHGEETRVWGDQAYRGQSEVLREHAPHAQDFTHQRYRYKDRIDEVEREKNRTKSKVRSKVEHVFAVMKLKFGFVKVRYRGLDKNAHRWSVNLCLGRTGR